MRWAMVWLASLACSYAPARSGDDDPASDGPSPPGDDAPAGSLCFGTVDRVCLERLPATGFTLGGAENLLITDMPDMCEPTTPGSTLTACVIAGTTITIDGSLTAVGARPLVLLATEGTITIPANGLVDVASHRATASRGAGANPIGLCVGLVAATGSGGGAGGSFGGQGGTGGTGNGVGAGIPGPIIDPPGLRGGCAGGLGGTPIGSMDGGDGGGAVLLIAPAITIDGRINASGEGGLGGSGSNSVARGGAGGGSGGMIVFDTTALTIGLTGIVMAQGGGGGESSEGSTSGNPGQDPDPVFPGFAAAGGGGAAAGAQNGGAGGTTGGGLPGINGLSTNGGGGGGGTGVIRNLAISSSINGVVVP